MTINARSFPVWAQRIIAIVSFVGIATCLLVSGLTVCAIPDTPTKALSSAFNLYETSPFNTDELVEMALATKDYTVENHDYTELMETQIRINTQLQNRSEIHTPHMPYVNESSYDDIFKYAHEKYALDSDAISHLDDVYNVIHNVSTLVVIVVICTIISVFIYARIDKKGLGRTLMRSTYAVSGFFALLAIWAIIDFDGMFEVFHSLFFAQGTWSFSWDSLLISMYPPNFWMGMGVIWLIVTLICCGICLIIGKLLNKLPMRHTDAY